MALKAVRLEDLVDHFLSPRYPSAPEPYTATLTPGQIIFEAEMMEDEEDEKLQEEILFKAGNELRALGDAFFLEHSTAASFHQTFSLDALVEKLRNLFNQLRSSQNNPPQRAVQQEAEAYGTFSDILLNAISRNNTADVRQRLGAYMLCLDRLSNLDEPVKDVARKFSVQYIQKELGISNGEQLNTILKLDEEVD